jgi:hypothetical protein
MYKTPWMVIFMLFVLPVWGEEADFLHEFNLSRPKIMMHTDKWDVKPETLDIDTVPYKGQSKSLTDWKNTPAQKLLDFFYWKAQRKERDRMPDWKMRLRDSRHVEQFGKIIQCVFKCEIFRGMYSSYGQYLSHLSEGDELKNHGNSYVWVVLAENFICAMSFKS